MKLFVIFGAIIANGLSAKVSVHANERGGYTEKYLRDF